MGAVATTPRGVGAKGDDMAEYMIGEFVGEKSYPIASDFWQKLLEVALNLSWPTSYVIQASIRFANNNRSTRHLSKILVHLALNLRECGTLSDAPSSAYYKAVNAAYIASFFLKYLIENARSNKLDELYLSLDETDPVPDHWKLDQSIENLVMRNVLSFLGSVHVSPSTRLLHQELLHFMLVAMSTQLLYGPSPGPSDSNPFIDAAMAQDSVVVSTVVRALLLNYIMRPQTRLSNSSLPVLSGETQPGVLQRVSSAAASIVFLPFNYLANSNSLGWRTELSDCSLHVLLILYYYNKFVVVEGSASDKDNDESLLLESFPDVNTQFSGNPYSKALSTARDHEFDRVDIEGNGQNGMIVKLSFAALFDALGISLASETASLLLYTLIHGNTDFLEYCLVRTDLDTLLMPLLETLYHASKTTSNHIYLLLIILLILSQDSSFNSSIHKMILPHVSWYRDHHLLQISLGSLMVVILIKTVKYNLSKLRDLYLHTTCLATLANMAPHTHRLSAYASQRLVSLFCMLSRKYNKLAERINAKVGKQSLTGDNNLGEDMSAELHIYTDFLRIVLEILNAILTYALPRNPEVVYAIMHRQEVFHPFKNHPRFHELIENIFLVLEYFNYRLDTETQEGELSVEKVLQLITTQCRSWRGDGMKMFTQLHFSYEQESHPEEFFTPYIWRLALLHCGLNFRADCINMFLMERSLELEDSEDDLSSQEIKNRLEVLIDV